MDLLNLSTGIFSPYFLLFLGSVSLENGPGISYRLNKHKMGFTSTKAIQLPPELLFQICDLLDTPTLLSAARSKVMHEASMYVLFLRHARHSKDRFFSLLHWGVFKNSVGIVERALGVGADINRIHSLASMLLPLTGTPLHVAAADGNTGMVRRLLGRGASIDYFAKMDAYSIDWVDGKFVRLSPGELRAEVSPLYAAIARGEASTARCLLGAGASLWVSNCNAKPINAIHIAAFAGLVPLIHELIDDYGASVDVADSSGWTPLHWAASSDRGLEALRCLIDRGAKVNARTADFQTAAHAVAKAKVQDVDLTLPKLQLLMAAGARANPRDVEGNTPLKLALQSHFAGLLEALTSLVEDGGMRPSCAEALLLDFLEHYERKKGYARGDFWSNSYLRRMLGVASRACLDRLLEGCLYRDHGTAADLVRQYGARVSAELQEVLRERVSKAIEQDSDQDLIYKLRYYKCPPPVMENLMQKLVLRGPRVHEAIEKVVVPTLDVNWRNEDGETVLHFLLSGPKYYHPESDALLETLLLFGADVNARTKTGCTPLHYLASNPLEWRRGSFGKILQRLKEHGVDVNRRNDDGETAVHRLLDAKATSDYPDATDYWLVPTVRMEFWSVRFHQLVSKGFKVAALEPEVQSGVKEAFRNPPSSDTMNQGFAALQAHYRQG